MLEKKGVLSPYTLCVCVHARVVGQRLHAQGNACRAEVEGRQSTNYPHKIHTITHTVFGVTCTVHT